MQKSAQSVVFSRVRNLTCSLRILLIVGYQTSFSNNRRLIRLPFCKIYPRAIKPRTTSDCRVATEN